MQKPLFNAPIPTQQASLASPVASAIGNMGSAVKKVGKIAAQLQQEQERQILAEAELKMKKSSYELKDKLTNEHDPSKHVEIAQQHFDKLQGTILNNDKLTPGFQNDLGDRLKMFTESKLMGIESDAKLQQVDNGRKLQVARIEMYQQEGDFEQAEAALNEGVGVYWGKEHAEAGKMKLKSAAKTAELNLMINETPNEAIEYLTAKDKEGNYVNGGISPDRRRISVNKARTAMSQYRKAAVDDWELKIDNGFDNPDAIMNDENEYLTEKDKSQLIASMVRSTPPTAKEFAKGSALIDDYIEFAKTASEPEKLEVYMNVERHLKSVYQKGSENQLMLRFEEYSPYKQMKSKRGNLNGMAQIWITSAKKNGAKAFGEEDSLEADLYEKEVREEIFEFIKNNPDATEEDVRVRLKQHLEVSEGSDNPQEGRKKFEKNLTRSNQVEESSIGIQNYGSTGGNYRTQGIPEIIIP